jgi:hypothetical protein
MDRQPSSGFPLGSAHVLEPLSYLSFLEPQLGSNPIRGDAQRFTIRTDPPLALTQHLGYRFGV